MKTVLLIGLFLLTANARAEFVSLDSYLDQVKHMNGSVRGSLETSAGTRLRSNEGALITSPSLFANLTSTDDKAPKLNPLAQGTETVTKNYSGGFMYQSPIGTSLKLYYSATYMDVRGASQVYVQNPTAWDTKPVIELTQPLWRNIIGNETRASVEAANSAALAASWTDQYVVKQGLSAAEAAYWRLSAAREALEIQRGSLERQTKIRDWTAQKVKYRLADESDELQASAAVRLRELELQVAIDEVRTAAQTFNTTRGMQATTVDERLESVLAFDPDNISVPRRASRRADVEAALYQEKAADAAAMLGAQKNLPTLELFGSYARNGHDLVSSTSMTQSTWAANPTTTIGLKLVAPIRWGLVMENREGYAREARGAALKYEQKVADQEKDWVDLLSKYGEAKRRLELSKRIEEVQKSKYQRERDRHSKGRTTTFMVLQFEQDFASAQLARLRTQTEILGLVAQMKTFGSAVGGDTK